MLAAAVVVVAGSYLLLLPHGRQYPQDHGRAQLATFDLSPEWEDYYACLIGWAEDSGHELRITDDFILEPTDHLYGGFRIEASGLTNASGGYVDGGLWAVVGIGKSRVPFGEPCRLP